MKSVKNNMELTTFDEHLEKRYGPMEVKSGQNLKLKQRHLQLEK